MTASSVPGSGARPCLDERGSGTVLTGVLGITLCVAMLVGVWICGWIGSLHEARSAADLAALAGAQAQVAGRDVCDAAREVADRNGARVVSCRLQGDRRDFVVRVVVRATLRPVIAGRAWSVEQDAVAGSQPVK